VTATVAVIASFDRGGTPGKPGTASRWHLPRFAGWARSGPAGRAPDSNLDGLVLDPAGQPIAGAVITARAGRPPGPGRMSFGTERPTPVAQAISDQRGSFHLASLPAGRYGIAAAHPGFVGAYLREVEAPHSGRIELRLGTDGFALTGQVLDQGGGPIPGARVMAQGRWLAMFTAVATAQGEYSLVLPEPASALVVTAGGYGPMTVPGRFTTEERRDFRLAPAARVSGRVVTQGRGVGGALVRLLPVGGARDRWEEEAATDAEGRFTIADLPASTYKPLVRQGALVNRAAPLLNLRAGGVETVELTLEPGITIRGHLRDLGGHPVPGAGVGAVEPRERFFEAGVGTLAEAAADGEGRFVLEGIPPRTIELLPAAVGYTGRNRTIEVGAQATVEIDLALEPASGVVGVVYRADGSPAVNAEVRGRAREVGGRQRTGSLGRADASGRFEVRGLGAGEITLTGRGGGEVAQLAPFLLEPGARKEVKVVLQPGAFVSGRVRFDDGRPAPGVKVQAMGGPVDPRPGESLHHDIVHEPVRTDAGGAFTVGPFLPGRITAAAFAPGEREGISSNARPNQAQAVVAAGQHVTGLELLLSSGRGRITGITLDHAGARLAGATLIAVPELPQQTSYPGDLHARQSTSGGDGAFVLDGLAQGAFTLFGRHPDHPDLRVTGVRAGSNDVEVRFASAARLTGVVRTRRGTPVKDYFIAVSPVVRPGERPSPDVPRLDVTDPRGAFALSRLSAGRYDVTVTTADGLVARAPGVSLAEGDASRVVLVAEPGAVAVGRVIDDATGAAAAGVKLTVPMPGMRFLESVTDTGGAFRLRGLIPGGKARISAFREQDAGSGRVEIEAGAGGATVDAGTIRLRGRPAPPPTAAAR
jgi:hypothetical protein